MSIARSLRAARKSISRRMFIEALEDRKVLDADPLLIKDINTSNNPYQLYSASESPTVFGSIGLYRGYSLATGRELWRTDGTASGTYLVKDIEPGVGDSYPSSFVETDGTYYFTARTSQTGYELWKTDGTEAGTSMLKDIYPGETSSNPSSLYAADGKLYFSATSPDFGTELWTSDGTTAGTHVLADLIPGPASNGVSEIYNVGNHLLFNTYTFRSTIASLDLLTGSVEYPAQPFRFGTPVEQSNGKILFADSSDSGTKLWTSDGTIAGTTLVADLEPNGFSTPTILTRWNNQTIVYYGEGATRRVASLSDGGVFEILVESPLSQGILTVSATLSDQLLIASPSKLYSSDGTAAGTTEVVLPIGFSVDLSSSALLAGSLYFGLSGVGFGVAKYDPTSGSVSRVTDGRPSPAYSFRATADGLYWLESGLDAKMLFTADGVIVGELSDDGFNSWIQVQSLNTINGNLTFVGVNQAGIALRGATGNSIIKLSPIEIGPTADSITSSNTVQFNGFQFLGVFLDSGVEFWRTDGTESGTIQLTPNNFGFSALRIVATETKVYAVGQGPTGVELWSTDGTVDGTSLVKTLSFQPDWIVAYQDQIVIAGNGGLWASDGTAGELNFVASISDTVASQEPAVWNDAIYFNGYLNGTDSVWKLQGLANPTLTSVPNTSGLHFMQSVTNDNAIAFLSAANELWISHDGFETNTFLASNVSQLKFVSGMLYYVEYVSNSWHIKRSDAGETISALDLGSYFSALEEVDGILYAKTLMPNGKWNVLSATGVHGTLESASELNGFNDVLTGWQFRDLGGKAIGPVRFSFFGAELGITSPNSRIVLDNSVITENNAPQSVVGALGTAWTKDALGQPTFSLVPGFGSDSNDLFTIDSNNNLVSINSLDTEVQRLHSIRVRADYPGGESLENVLTVFVQNVSEPLDQIFLIGQTAREDATQGFQVGRFIAPLAQPGETISYELLSVDGSQLNLPFLIQGDRLLVNSPLDFETSANPRIEVRITSSFGVTALRVFQIFVSDVNENNVAPIRLSNSAFFENNLGSVLVGTLFVPNSSDAFQFSLDPTWHESTLFSLVGNDLYFNSFADRETRENFSIRVVGTNGTTVLASALTIDILGVDEFPITGLRFIADGIDSDLPFLNENSPIGMPATRIQVLDQDQGDSYTFSGSFGSLDGLGDFATIVGDSFVPIRDINYETLTQIFGFRVNIAIATNGVPSYSVSWDTSTIRDVNDPPVVANPISNRQVESDVFTPISLAGTFVDEDASDSLTLTATLNGGQLPSWLFFASLDTLAVAPSSADAGVYVVAVTATDGSGATVTSTFTLTVEAPININGTTGNDTIRITPTNDTGSWDVFVNGRRTFQGTLNRPLLINGFTGNDRLIIEGTTSTDSFFFGGPEIKVGSLRSKFYDFEAIEIRGRGGNDRFQTTGDFILTDSFTVVGGAGSDTLIGATFNTWFINGADSGIVGQIAFSSVENLVGGTGGDQFVMLSGGRISGNIDGNGGYDQLDYSQRNSNVSVTLDDLDLQAGDATNVNHFSGISVFNGREIRDNTFTLADSIAGQAARWETFPNSTVRLESQTIITGFKSLVGSPNDDVFYLGEGASEFNIDGSTGTDQISQTSTLSTLDLRAGTGTGIASFRRIEKFLSFAAVSELYGPNANTTWAVTQDSVSYAQSPAFQNYQTIYGGNRNDTFELAPYFSWTNNIVGGAGTDVIKTVGPPPGSSFTTQANWKLNGVGSGQVTSMQVSSTNFSGIENLVGGQVDFDFIDFSSVPTQTWFNSLTGLVTGNIVVTYPASATVSGTTTVNPVNDPPVLVNLETKTATGFGSFDLVQFWIGNSNSDRLIGRNLDTNWFINGSTGSDSRTNFQGFETIVGGTRNDVFQISFNSANIPNRVEGGTGQNTLDFRFFPLPVNINLTTGTASPFVLGHSGFVDVIGSSFDDTITGNSADNILVGLDGNDTLTGLAGNDVLLGGNGDDQLFGGNGRDLLIGGFGTDFLYGGNDDDLLISGESFLLNNVNLGTTAGLNRTGIAAVMTEWTSNRPYSQRQSRVRTGASSGGTYRMDSSTLFEDGAVDQLFGEGGQDCFWLGGSDLTSNSDNTEVKNLI